MVQSRKKLDADLRIVGIVHVRGRFSRSPSICICMGQNTFSMVISYFSPKLCETQLVSSH